MAAGLSSALLLVLIAVALGSTLAAIHLNRTTNEARQNAELAKAQMEKARFNQYVAQMNFVQREYEANNIAHVRELLAAQVPEGDETDLRNFEWHYWQRMVHRELLILKGHTGLVRCASFSPDGKRLASASDDNDSCLGRCQRPGATHPQRAHERGQWRVVQPGRKAAGLGQL